MTGGRLFDQYGDVIETFHENTDGTETIARTQPDVEPLLDTLKDVGSRTGGWSKSRDIRWKASIPVTLMAQFEIADGLRPGASFRMKGREFDSWLRRHLANYEKLKVKAH